MKRVTVYIPIVLAAVLAVGTMAGCGSRRVSESPSAKGMSSVAESTSPEQLYDENFTELKSAVAKKPSFKSVTAIEKVKLTMEGDFDATDDAATGEKGLEPEVFESANTYQFDASGDKLKTSMTGETSGITMQYFSDGDDVVYVTDGHAYSGTAEQFGLSHFAGVQAFLESEIGDLNSIVDCAAAVEKEQQDEVSVYKLTLDVQKYIASDEVLTLMAESGNSVLASTVTLGYDTKGRMVSASQVLEYDNSTTEVDIEFTDFDSTVVGPMPEATNSYDELMADEEEKYETLDEENDSTGRL